jgi:hypothetical protein
MLSGQRTLQNFYPVDLATFFLPVLLYKYGVMVLSFDDSSFRSGLSQVILHHTTAKINGMYS